MKTLSEIQAQESAVLERAAQYEKTLGLLTSAEREILTLTPRIAHFREQIQLLDDVATKARLIDPELVGKDSYATRDILVAHVGAAQANATAKIEKLEAQLNVLTAQVPQWRAAVEALTSN